MTGTSHRVRPMDAVPPKPLCLQDSTGGQRTVPFSLFVFRRPRGQGSSFPGGVPEAAQRREGFWRRQGETGERCKLGTCSSGTKLEKCCEEHVADPQSDPKGVEKEGWDQGGLWKFATMQKTTAYLKPTSELKNCKGSWAEIGL